MIRRIYLIGFFLLFSFSFAQKKENIAPVKLPKKLISYYQEILKAENAYVNGDNRESIKSYNKAFEINSKPFGEDVLNSFLISLKGNDYKMAFKSYKKLKNLRYDFSTINIENKNYISFIKKYDTKIKKYKPILASYDSMYKNKLDTLHHNDQLYRTDYIANKSKIDSTDINNAIILKNYIIKYGFPSEYEIGMQRDNSFLAFYYIIWHQLGRDIEIRKWYMQSLSKAVEEGKIKNTNAISLQDILSGTMAYKIDIVSFDIENSGNECCYIKKLTPTIKAEIVNMDKIRLSYGLLSYQEQIDKNITFFKKIKKLKPEETSDDVILFHQITFDVSEDMFKNFLKVYTKIPL